MVVLLLIDSLRILASTMNKNNYRLTAICELTNNVAQLILQPIDKPIHFKAGQYIHVLFPDQSWQPLSIANAMAPGQHIELHIRFRDDNTKNFLANVKKTKQVVISQALGKCYYRKDPPNPIILLAGGTGFAPLKAIIEKAIVEQDQRSFKLYWGSRIVSDFYLCQLLGSWQNSLNFSSTLVISQPQADTNWQGRVGYIHDAVIKDHPKLTAYQVYAAGPQMLVLAAHKLFCAHGLAPELFYSDWIEAPKA